VSLLLKFSAPLMLEREQSSAMTPEIAADAPVQGGGSAQRVDRLASTRAVAQYSYLSVACASRKAHNRPASADTYSIFQPHLPHFPALIFRIK